MKRNRKGDSYHHGDLAHSLLEVSEKLVLKKGAAAFSMREAARIIGVDPSACYRHFSDKNAILKAIASKGFTELAKFMNEELIAKKNISTDEKLELLGKSYFRFATEKRAFFHIMFGQLGVDSRDPSLAGEYPLGDGPYDILLKTMTFWLNEHKLKKDANEAAVQLWSAVHGLTHLILDGAIRTELTSQKPEHIISNLVKTVLLGIRK